jgi:hypothetical protein
MRHWPHIGAVVVAFLIGGIEALGLLGDQLSLSGWFWNGIGALNDNFNNLGFSSLACSLRPGSVRLSSTATMASTTLR